MPDRRDFLLDTMRGIGLSVIGGVAWYGIISASKASPLILMPPGAISEEGFRAKCIRCGRCVDACPYRTLILSRPGDHFPLGTPFFVPRDNPCRMCRDIPCVPVCPSGALDRSLVSERDAQGNEVLSVNRARMGLAVIDRDTCIAYWGIQCDACYRTCPRIDKAITVDYARNDRTGKHALLGPVVHSSECTGCGMCEHACVTKKASIFVLPRNIAMGESSSRYVKGWDSRDEERMKDIPSETVTKTPRSERDPLDYLNTEDLK